MILGFFIIPNPKSDYVTFTVGNYTGGLNLVWISNLTPVYINAIFSLLAIFISQNLKKREINNNTFVNFRLSVESNFQLLMQKVVSLFFYLTILAFILEIIILVINYQSYSLVSYLIPFFYFTVPYLFLLASICILIDYLVDLKFLKYILYFAFIIFIYNNSIRHTLDITGIQELMDNFASLNAQTKDKFILGAVKTKDIEFVNFNNFINPKDWLSKIYLLPISLILVLAGSFVFNRFSVIRKSEQNPPVIKKETNASAIKEKTYHPIAFVSSFNFRHLLKAEFFLLRNSISKNLKLVALVLWILAFFVHGEIKILIIAAVFITLLPLNQNYLAGKYTNNTFYAEKISGYPLLMFIVSKFLLFLVYIVVVIPVLDYTSIEISSFIIFKLLFLFIFQLAYTTLVKDYLLVEIILIIIFSSYFSGVPVYQIF
ncbi:hypothetical protein ACM39_01240 [Chryseobacterium sp. FH2]|nr:hypothetical protein ACM39_01240 [Chryseobacterium sp. FH2]